MPPERSVAPVVEAGPIRLRPVRRDDFEPYARQWADSRTTAFIGGHPRPRDVSWGKFCQMAGFWPLLGYGYWTVAEAASDDYAGVCGLGRFERGIALLDGVPEAGWAIAPEHWGQGWAGAAVAAMLGWADTVLAIETGSLIAHGNAPSLRIAEANGFRPIGAAGDAELFARQAGAVTPPGVAVTSSPRL